MNQAGVQTKLEFLEDGSMVRHDRFDATQVVEDNRIERLSGENDQRGKNARKFASVPVAALQMLKDQFGIDWTLVGKCPDTTGRFFTWLNENPYFRTSEADLGKANRFVR